MDKARTTVKDAARDKARSIKNVIDTGLQANEGPAVMQGRQLESYRIMTKVVQRAVVLMGFIILVLAGTLLYNIKYRIANDRFFAEAAGVGKMQMLGLRNPYLNQAAVSTWVSMASASILTFGFNDMQARFDANSKFFTPAGWKSFTAAMESSGLLTTVNQNQQIITSIAQSPPSFAFIGMRQGKYTWVVDIPMSMTIRAGNKVISRTSYVRLTLIRMPTAANPMGIGIDTWFSS